METKKYKRKSFLERIVIAGLLAVFFFIPIYSVKDMAVKRVSQRNKPASELISSYRVPLVLDTPSVIVKRTSEKKDRLQEMRCQWILQT